MDISVVIPVYGCKAALPELHRRLCETLEQITGSFEIVLVDDCCPQNSWESIREICEKDKRVVGIHLSRNFGQIRAITAGVENARGEWVVVMDCDLQDRPETIAKLYEKAKEGYDVVFVKRAERKDSFVTKLLSKTFYKVYSHFTNGTYDSSLCNFSISKREVMKNYCMMREQNRSFVMFIRWLGFKQATIEAVEDARFEGKSSYSFRKKIRMATEIITSQSNKPLLFSIRVGFFVALLALGYIIYLVLRSLIVGDVLMGWTTVVASIYLMGGILLCAVGVVGLYIGNIFEEVKHRPIYVIGEILNPPEKEQTIGATCKD